MISKEELFNKMIFLNETLHSILRQFPDQKVEIRTWYLNEEYKLLQKTKRYFLSKSKSNSRFNEEIDLFSAESPERDSDGRCDLAES
ncbi:MAG: hypothetical protein ABJH04_15585 [Cyclobacteriaceae bacterium]